MYEVRKATIAPWRSVAVLALAALLAGCGPQAQYERDQQEINQEIADDNAADEDSQPPAKRAPMTMDDAAPLDNGAAATK